LKKKNGADCGQKIVARIITIRRLKKIQKIQDEQQPRLFGSSSSAGGCDLADSLIVSVLGGAINTLSMALMRCLG